MQYEYMRSCFKLLLIVVLLTGHFYHLPAIACSMFKITRYGKTMVGNNEDAWREGQHIWFEQGSSGKWGAAYVGHDDLFPQGGINEAGLAYDGFTVLSRKPKHAAGKEQITAVAFLKMLMQQCSTIEEVQALAGRYDRSVFNSAMLLFVDKTGKYLVMEVDTMTTGNEPQYVLSNFCPSLTPDAAVNIKRYQRGRKFIAHEGDTSLAYSRAAMDTMHECRPRLGDGTTYTTIYDLKQGIIHLYFYHDFRHEVSFVLKEELCKGNHALRMDSLFPPNAEYALFLRHKTPFNSRLLLCFCLIAAAFFISGAACAAILFIKDIFQKGRAQALRKSYSWLLLAAMDSALAYYLFKLLTVHQIYYFNAPYSEPGNVLLNAAAYLPWMLAVFLIPVITKNIKYLRSRAGYAFPKIVFTLHTAFYLVLTSLFFYWGLLTLTG